MPSPLRRTLVALAFALAAAWAWRPLFQHGLRGDELSHARALGAVDGLEAAVRLDPTLARPLAAVAGGVLARTLSGAAPLAELFGWRAHHVLALLLAAWLLGRFTRRLSEPWIGAELARAAGWAASMLFALHPLSVAALASVRAGAMLWGLALSLASAWCFLRGRQERDARGLWAAAALAVAAALSHGVALALPLWLAGAEYAASARRRTSAAKASAALSAAAAAAGCVAIDSLLRSAVSGGVALPPEISAALVALRSPVELAATGVERLGMLWLAVNAHVAPAPCFALAGLAALATVHPMLGAARAAPRLWGWILVAFVLALLSTELVVGRARVHALDWSQADTLLPAAAVASAACALAITSRSGLLRVALPALVGGLFAVLASFDASAYAAAARETAAVRAVVESAGAGAIVVDAPSRVMGVKALEDSPWRRADRQAFAAWLSSDAALSARAAGAQWLHRSRADGGWRLAALRPARAPAAPVSWLREGRSPDLACDPLGSGALLVSFDSPLESARPLVMAWRTVAREGQPEQEGRCEGVFTELGAAPQACFDLEQELAWLASDEVRLIWSESGWSRIDSAQLVAHLPAPPFEVAPRVQGDDWSFARAAPSPTGSLERAYELRLIDLEGLESHEFAAQVAQDGALVFRGAEQRRRALAERGVKSLVWRLEGLIESRAVERATGDVR